MPFVVIVPTYNEVENLEILAQQVLALRPDVGIVCVDDDSPDGTGDLADRIAAHDRRFSVIHRVGKKRGYAASSVEGLAEAARTGCEFICTMDADLSHDPASLPALVSKAEEGFDLVIGSRYVPEGLLEVDWGPFRRAVSRSGSAYARRMLGTSVRDCTSGFRCYSRRAVDAVLRADIASDGYSFLVEALHSVLSADFTVAEEGIHYVDRKRGASKISAAIIGEALLRTTALGLSRLTRTGAGRSGTDSDSPGGPM